jgi:hypothetical protein
MTYETQKRSSSKGKMDADAKKEKDAKKEAAPVKKSTKSNRL